MATRDTISIQNCQVKHVECLAEPKYVSTGNETDYVAVENVCANSISARVCAKYSRAGWVCRLYPGVLPHGVLKNAWNLATTGSGTDVKAWATDYESGSHADDYKNLPTVKVPNIPCFQDDVCWHSESALRADRESLDSPARRFSSLPKLSKASL